MIAAALALLRMMAKLAAAGLAAAALGLFLVSLVYAAESDNLAQAGAAQQKETKAEAKSAMTRCLETWDPAKQMSKQEWRESCERTTKQNPNLYDKPY
jgi:hypothetical protein